MFAGRGCLVTVWEKLFHTVREPCWKRRDFLFAARTRHSAARVDKAVSTGLRAVSHCPAVIRRALF